MLELSVLNEMNYGAMHIDDSTTIMRSGF